jgi:hypothetical protein
MKPGWFLVCILWLVAAGAGAWVVANYDSTPSASGETPQQWPVASQVDFQHTEPVLVMFAHPECPCTRASIGELNRLMAQCAGKVAAHVVFIEYDDLPKDGTQGALWKSAASIPGVQVRRDLEGHEARLFGAEASGYVVLYDSKGGLLFKGGITSARGHAGDNAGENAIIALLSGREAPLAQTPVFGCGLLDETELAAKQP